MKSKKEAGVRKNKDEAKLDQLFFALSDRTRRSLLSSLSKGDSSVTELSEPFDVSLQSILKHLAVLEDAGLVTVEKTGRVKKCHFVPENLSPATEWVNKYEAHWKKQLQGLEKYLEEMSEE